MINIVKHRKKLKAEWFSNLMLKKSVAELDTEVKTDYLMSSKKAIVDYILLDKEERNRLNIKVRKQNCPRIFEASV